MDDTQVQARCQEIEAEGKSRLGEKGWGDVMRALRKSNAPAPALRQIVEAPNAADLLLTAGREALIAQASDGDRDAEAAYQRIRAGEREAYRAMKGRVA